VAHGGALGADHYVLKALLAHSGVSRSVLYSAWQSQASFPKVVQPDIAQFVELGGRVLWGGGNSGMPYPAVAAALLARNVRLVSQCHGLVAFLHGKSKGTLSTVAQAQRRKLPIILFPLSDHIDLPQLTWNNRFQETWIQLGLTTMCVQRLQYTKFKGGTGYERNIKLYGARCPQGKYFGGNF
jgi:hypothetical protein